MDFTLTNETQTTAVYKKGNSISMPSSSVANSSVCGCCITAGQDKVSMFDLQSPCKETQAGFKQTPGEAVDKPFGI